MKTITILYTALIIAGLTLVSCKKEEEKESTNQLLTNRSQKTWVLRSVLQKDKEIVNEEWKEIYLSTTEKNQLGWKEGLVTCQQDNEWTFYDDGKVIKNPGFVRCNIAEKDTTLTYFLGGPKNESIYFKEQKQQWVWLPDLLKDSVFVFDQIQKTDILVLTKDELKYKSVYYAPLGNYVTTSIYSFIRK